MFWECWAVSFPRGSVFCAKTPGLGSNPTHKARDLVESSFSYVFFCVKFRMMFLVSCKNKVVNFVITWIPIFMMDNIFRCKRFAKMFAKYISRFFYPFSITRFNHWKKYAFMFKQRFISASFPNNFHRISMPFKSIIMNLAKPFSVRIPLTVNNRTFFNCFNISSCVQRSKQWAIEFKSLPMKIAKSFTPMFSWTPFNFTVFNHENCHTLHMLHCQVNNE